MRVRRTFLSAAFGVGLTLTAVGGTAGVAHAEKSTLINPDYVGAPTVVQGETVSQPAVLGETVTAPEETARSSTLPITGGDVVGLAAVGLAMVGVGIPLVRRGRRRA